MPGVKWHLSNDTLLFYEMTDDEEKLADLTPSAVLNTNGTLGYVHSMFKYLYLDGGIYLEKLNLLNKIDFHCGLELYFEDNLEIWCQSGQRQVFTAPHLD